MVKNFKTHDLSNTDNYKKTYEVVINDSDLSYLITKILEYSEKNNFNIDKESIQKLLTIAVNDITYEFGNDEIERELFTAIYESVDLFVEDNLSGTEIWERHIAPKKFNL